MGQRLLVELIEEIPVVPLEVDQKLIDCSNKQADAAKIAHVGCDMHRVHAPLAQISLEKAGQGLQGRLEYLGLTLVRGQMITHGPQRFVSDVGDRVGGCRDVEGIAPLDIETELLHRLLIGAIMHLLEDHQPHHRVQSFGGPAMAVMIMPAQGLDRQLRENMLLEKPAQELSRSFRRLGPK